MKIFFYDNRTKIKKEIEKNPTEVFKKYYQDPKNKSIPNIEFIEKQYSFRRCFCDKKTLGNLSPEVKKRNNTI